MVIKRSSNKKKSPLKGKKFLITAGPTWVRLDPVRVISNISTGVSGLTIARELKNRGAKVTLLLGPGEVAPDRKLRALRFRFFSDLDRLLERQLEKNSFDCIIHNAAVSDFLAKENKSKISSGRDSLLLKLYKAPKLIEKIARLKRGARLVCFKLESSPDKNFLIKQANRLFKTSPADIVVANVFCNCQLESFILNRQSVLGKATGRLNAARKLVAILETML